MIEVFSYIFRCSTHLIQVNKCYFGRKKKQKQIFKLGQKVIFLQLRRLTRREEKNEKACVERRTEWNPPSKLGSELRTTRRVERCRPPPRLERPLRDIGTSGAGPHWSFTFRGANVGVLQRESLQLLGRDFRPSETVFEVGGHHGKEQIRVRAELRG